MNTKLRLLNGKRHEELMEWWCQDWQGLGLWPLQEPPDNPDSADSLPDPENEGAPP